MTAGPDETWSAAVHDSFEAHATESSQELLHGAVWSVRRDRVVMPSGQVADRDVLVHPGAVAVVAVDERERVLLIRQYRHPPGMYLFEAPAGLLDIEGEDPFDTARRELAEEAGIEAATWNVLVDFLNSPGGSTEALRCYLARDITELPGGRPRTGEAEEYHLPRAWVPIDEARDLALSGALNNVTAVMGILAAHAARSRGWSGLREPSAPWPVRDHLLAHGRVRS